MSQGDVLEKIVAKLDAVGIPYMLSGSVASSIYGKARSTEDIDLIIFPTIAQLNALLAALPSEEYYASPETAREAFFERSMFNVIDLTTGWKVDLIFLKRREFELEEFARRVTREVLGRQISVVTPEDSILSKLEWRKESKSERQYVDAVNVAARIENLDLAYLRLWAKELGVSKDLEQLLHDADELRPR
jgi:hypothetical protein